VGNSSLTSIVKLGCSGCSSWRGDCCVTCASLCSAAFRAHRLEMIMEGKCALDIFAEIKYFHLVVIMIQSQQKGQELIGK